MSIRRIIFNTKLGAGAGAGKSEAGDPKLGIEFDGNQTNLTNPTNLTEIGRVSCFKSIDLKPEIRLILGKFV